MSALTNYLSPSNGRPSDVCARASDQRRIFEGSKKDNFGIREGASSPENPCRKYKIKPSVMREIYTRRPKIVRSNLVNVLQGIPGHMLWDPLLYKRDPLLRKIIPILIPMCAL